MVIVRYKDREYSDRTVPIIDAEITKFMVAVVPADLEAQSLRPGHAGSGTCVTIGGRFFVATAAHVILDHKKLGYAITSETATDFVYLMKGSGTRGGRPRDDIDLGWLELHNEHARGLGREFLPLQRMRTHCNGRNEALAVAGAPIVDQHRDSSSRDKPILSLGAQWYPVGPLFKREELGEEPDLARRLYLHWPKHVEDNSGNVVEHPEAFGISGGGIWALNVAQENWSPRCIQLVGIEYSWEHRGVPDRFLRAYQMQLWLQMLAEDIPALRPEIEPFIEAGRHQLPRAGSGST
jgi:hypothetical protein